MNRWGKVYAVPVGAAILTASAAFAEPAARPTFAKDVLPILQENCQECHRAAGANFSGMVAPMALTSYEEARPWAKAIAREVSNKTMPPWFAAEQHKGQFELERSLSDDEIETLVRWANTGARQGNPDDAPPPRKFPSTEGWTYGEPDLVVKLPEPYWVADDVRDVQPGFSVVLTEDQLPEDKWIHWIEFRPGSDIVHHGGARVTPLDENGKPVMNDPICGGKLIGTAQGDGPDYWPEGYGKLVRKGSRISFGMHYNKEPGPGTGRWDQSMIAIKWHEKPVKYVVRSAGISSRGWEIPPYHKNWQVGAAITLDQDSILINMMPHMHYRGAAAKYEAIYPDGKRELLLDVPGYDFAWQQTYTFKEPKYMPAGTRVECSMWFDNSTDNVWVKDPERPIGWGGMTDDEMNIGWTEFANAEPIDDIMSHDFGDSILGIADLDDVE